MTQDNKIVNCTVSVEGIILDFQLPLKVAVAYNNMRSDELAGLLPLIIDHFSMSSVSVDMKQKMQQHIELMELSYSRVEININTEHTK